MQTVIVWTNQHVFILSFSERQFWFYINWFVYVQLHGASLCNKRQNEKSGCDRCLICAAAHVWDAFACTIFVLQLRWILKTRKTWSMQNNFNKWDIFIKYLYIIYWIWKRVSIYYIIIHICAIKSWKIFFSILVINLL